MVRFPDPISKVGARWMTVMVLSSSKSLLDTLIVARLDAPVELGWTVMWIISSLRVAVTQLSETEDISQELTFSVLTETSCSPPDASKERLPAGVNVKVASPCPNKFNPTIVMTTRRTNRSVLIVFIMFIILLNLFRFYWVNRYIIAPMRILAIVDKTIVNHGFDVSVVVSSLLCVSEFSSSG